MFKDLVQRGANLAGYNIIPEWKLADLPLARCLAKLFSRHGITSVLDIGANVGHYRDFLRTEVRFAGHIVSFEPDPLLAAGLTARAAREDAKWTIHSYALGAARETRQFHRMRDSHFNSFLDPLQDMPANMTTFNEVTDSFAVEVRTLDELAPQLGDLPHTYVKIDTQGFDLEVLKGGLTALRQVPALQTEISFLQIYSHMPSFTQSLAAFRDAGFEVADMFRISADDHGRAIEFDCVMTRSAP